MINVAERKAIARLEAANRAEQTLKEEAEREATTRAEAERLALAARHAEELALAKVKARKHQRALDAASLLKTAQDVAHARVA